MNSQEQGKGSTDGNDEIRLQVDKMLMSQLKRMEASDEDLSGAMIQALTTRYGKPSVTLEQLDELERQLRLVGGGDGGAA